MPRSPTTATIRGVGRPLSPLLPAPSVPLEELAQARAAGSYPRILDRLQKTRLIVIHDFGLAPLGESGRRHLFEVLGNRVGRKTILVTSQLPLEHWHQALGDSTLADAILDRIVHHAHRIQLKGGSMRENKPNPPQSTTTNSEA